MSIIYDCSYAELNNLTGLYSGERYLLNINAKKRKCREIIDCEATPLLEIPEALF